MTDSIQVPDGYSFVRIINSGGFGTVVEMIEKSTNTHYAGKIVQCLTQKHKDRFDREVGRLKTFSHPRIIKLKETLTMEGRQVMVLELGGRSLAEVVQDYAQRHVPMPPDEVYRVMEDISSALEMMHEHESGRTAHGDIKIENILMDADGHAKLCDFGAAESEHVNSSRSVMSELYVSPERMDSETGKATCEADVWALGVILFWLLFGEPPFKSQNTARLIREIGSFKATSIKNTCGEEERALLMRMMDPSADSRITCRQLRLSKSFQCIVNTLEGVWKLKDAELKEQSARFADVESRLLNENALLMSLLTMPPAWAGTESLSTVDRTAHRLTPTTLTQILKLENATDWRTAFTVPIDEDEWELKIRGNKTPWGVVLGFLRHPLPENATEIQCGQYGSGIGGHFELWSGRLWKGGEFKPAGTNKKCDRAGQTAAIRVNMTTREARLFVDDEEQPGIFTDIPSPLCLGISTHIHKWTVEVLHLARTDLLKTEQGQQAFSKSVRIQALEEEKLRAEEKMERMKMMMPTAWVGTDSLRTLNRTAHTLTPTTLTQIIKLEKDTDWRTSFTFQIDEGEWEFKIRGNNTCWHLMIGFLRHPLPENATQSGCGSYLSGIGGDFILWSGRMWQRGEFKPAGTNKKCDRAEQTAAIRVNMTTREARLFVDDEEQPGIFTDIPSPLCLGITTQEQNAPIEVLWLKRIWVILNEMLLYTMVRYKKLKIAQFAFICFQD
ncbi:putative Carbon catabolite-derepressing protein kinase [Blattamonas nauphoetae]|uniref:Carbon catabolite-derepressing protein kinase n=1 Tax=Blattamonas nauphoetae TaxID=2049346 RepID=A0ABQ9X0W0_9EUKA|nr:putative Carbon catabolite-derepressing protein kinase [Blattamonas nauphoetae]